MNPTKMVTGALNPMVEMTHSSDPTYATTTTPTGRFLSVISFHSCGAELMDTAILALHELFYISDYSLSLCRFSPANDNTSNSPADI